MAEFKRMCEGCRAALACKYTFNQFWKYKSSGGVGCDAPFTDKHAEAIEKAVFARTGKRIETMQMELI